MSLNVDVKPFMNAAINSRGERSVSKMIQNFENLFYQELLNVNDAGKLFTAQKIKHIIFLDTIIK